MKTLVPDAFGLPPSSAGGYRQIRVSLSIQPHLQPIMDRWLGSTSHRRCLRLHACRRRRTQVPWVLYLDVPAHRHGELLHWLRRLRRRPGVRRLCWESVPA